jgi:serine/threonine-protein kinase
MPLKFLGQDTGRLPRIDRYELIAELASGGMASVYLARLVGMGGFERFFAIKRLHPHLGSEEGFVSMFLDEARIVAGIRHQHVVPVLEVGASEHGYYLVMEYIEGETLGVFLSQGVDGGNPMPPGVAVRIALDSLAGLHAAHEHVDPDGHPIGLVHRDVSPQNILVDTNGVARIADFGVAHATSRLSTTRAGQLKGKVAYMAPEQARGENVSPRSDVFAAAIVLWECLTSRRLFLAENEAVTLNRLIFEPIPRLREVNPAMPDAVDRVLARALERDPAKRYATAADMADELQAAARASRMLASASDVKTYVRSVIGVAMERRRASVRDHLSRTIASEPLGATTSGHLDRPNLGLVKPSDSSVSSAAMAVPAPVSHPASLEVTSPAAAVEQQSASTKRLAFFITGGAGFGVLAVVATLFALDDGAPQTPGGPATGTSSSQVPATASAPPPTTSASTPAQTSASAASSSNVEPRATSTSVDKTPSTARTARTTPAPTKTEPTPTATTPAPTSEPPPAGTPDPTAPDDLKQNPYR